MATAITNTGLSFSSGTQTSVTGTKSLGTNGYYTLPNGTIMQWGTGTGTTAGGSANFPIAFPNLCCQAYATHLQGIGTIEAVRFDNSTITMVFGGSNNYGNTGTQFKWFAIGY